MFEDEDDIEFNEIDIKELIQQYIKLKQGKSHSYLDEDSFEMIVNYFDEKENLTEALHAVSLGLDQFPYSSELMYTKADLLIANQKFAEAIIQLEAAQSFDSNNMSLYILKTDALLALERNDEAIELLQIALEIFKGEEQLELLFELADVFDDYEKFDKVFDCLKLILELEPNNEEALYKICFWADHTGRLEESINIHTKIIDDFPFNEIAWFNLAAAYQCLKLYEKAIDAYKYAVAIEDKFDFAYRNMADAFIRLRKYRDAIEALEKVIELSKAEVVVYEAIGFCYQKLNNNSLARFYFKKALHLNSLDGKLHYKLAITYMNEQNWQQAIFHLDNALRFNKTSKEFNLSIGQCKMEIGNYSEAIFHFGAVVLHKPQSASGWEALIICLIKANLIDNAYERCKIAYELTERKPIFLYYLSTILFIQNKNKEALIQLENALIAAPKFIKQFLAVNKNILLNNSVVDLINRYKTNTRTKNKKK
jgi:tetratricopeptide (TPR) repeat protein